jgi:hypothetical protein
MARAARPAPAGTRLTGSERAAGKLLADWMRRSGLDIKALSALQNDRRLEIRRSVEAERAEASKQAAISHAIATGQAKTLRALAPKSGFFSVPSFTLDKPFRIRALPRGILRSSRIKPFDSFAKMRVDRRQEGQDKLFFHFRWSNQSTEPVAIDAVTLLSASGFLDLSVSSGVFLNFGFVTAIAQIALGPSVRDGVAHESRTLGAVSTTNTPLIPFDGHEARAASGVFNLTALHHPVGPLQTVFITISVTIDSDCGSSFRLIADFDSGLLGVSCPLVVVRVHQVPQTSLPD